MKCEQVASHPVNSRNADAKALAWHIRAYSAFRPRNPRARHPYNRYLEGLGTQSAADHECALMGRHLRDQGYAANW
jgi:hypothetical protein